VLSCCLSFKHGSLPCRRSKSNSFRIRRVHDPLPFHKQEKPPPILCFHALADSFSGSKKRSPSIQLLAHSFAITAEGGTRPSRLFRIYALYAQPETRVQSFHRIPNLAWVPLPREHMDHGLRSPTSWHSRENRDNIPCSLNRESR
jgi:hypothetical protein